MTILLSDQIVVALAECESDPMVQAMRQHFPDAEVLGIHDVITDECPDAGSPAPASERVPGAAGTSESLALSSGARPVT